MDQKSGKMQVNSRQRGNPILKHVRSWEFVDALAPDYVMGKKTCALYLSVKYHTLNPNYIHERLKQMGAVGFELKVLLVQVDVKEPHHALRQLMRIALLCDLTLMLAWSPRRSRPDPGQLPRHGGQAGRRHHGERATPTRTPNSSRA